MEQVVPKCNNPDEIFCICRNSGLFIYITITLAHNKMPCLADEVLFLFQLTAKPWIVSL